MTDEAIRSLAADEVAARTSTSYPAEFARRVAGRRKQVLGDPFGMIAGVHTKSCSQN